MINNIIDEEVRMDEYEKLMRDVIEQYDLTVKVDETKPGTVTSVITCIKIDLNCIGIAANVILRPYNENHNAEKGVYELQYLLKNAIVRHENMSFYKYAKYKRDNIWGDIDRVYGKWKEIESFLEFRLNIIHRNEIKEG